MHKNRILTLPNILGFYRILMFPVILCLALTRHEQLFAIFLIINLLTDIADGYIARKMKIVSEFGARLDSFADMLTYILAFTGIYLFKLEEFMPHIVWFGIFAGSLLLIPVTSLIRFGRLPGFHLYSIKIGGYIQGLFFITLFTIGFMPYYFYFMVIWGIASTIEHITIQFIIPELKTDIKGVYWILKKKNKTQ